MEQIMNTKIDVLLPMNHSGVRNSHLTDIATKIFDICNTTSWGAFEGRVLVIDLSYGNYRILQSAADIPMDSTGVVCPLAPVINKFQNELLRSRSVSGQSQLFFSPTQVA